MSLWGGQLSNIRVCSSRCTDHWSNMMICCGVSVLSRGIRGQNQESEVAVCFEIKIRRDWAYIQGKRRRNEGRTTVLVGRFQKSHQKSDLMYEVCDYKFWGDSPLWIRNKYQMSTKTRETMRIRDRSNCLTDRQSEVMTHRQYCVPRCPIRGQNGIPRRRFALH
jgi:hypothetical protein